MSRFLFLCIILALSSIDQAFAHTDCEVEDHFHRLRPFRFGSYHHLNDEELHEAELYLNRILLKLSETEGLFYSVERVVSCKEQVLNGIRKILNVELIDFNKVKHLCEVDLRSHDLILNGMKVSIKCGCMQIIIEKFSLE